MKYQANPIIVDAFPILYVSRHSREDGSRLLSVDFDGNEEEYIVSAPMLSRMLPVVGDYLVRQPDGYEYLNPKVVFESKYSPWDASAATVQGAQ